MIDRILYHLASPLAQEIIDSLRDDPGEWGPRSSHSVEELKNWRTALTVTAHGERYRRHGFDAAIVDAGPLSRIALRRAVRKWKSEND